jgi:hypothetical protein
MLASGLPEEWIRPGRTVEVRHAPTSHGILPGYALVCFPGGMAMRLLSAEKLANRGRGPVIAPGDLANPPGGLKWRIPGTRRIRQIIVDRERRKEIPPDRTLSLPPAFREVRILW